MKFKAEHTFEQRKAESERVRHKYPDRIPGIVHIISCFMKQRPNQVCFVFVDIISDLREDREEQY